MRTNAILFHIVALAAILWTTNFIIASIEEWPMSGASTEKQLEWLDLRTWINELVRIGIFFMGAFFLANKFVRPNYWKIALCLVASAVICFHIGYVASCIDYYWIKGLPHQHEGPMEQLNQLVSFTGPPSEPFYQPIEIFFQPFIILKYAQFRNDYSYVFFNFLFGALTMPLWVSAVAYVIVKRKQKKSVKENIESESPSTLDNS